jgi:hypothetical protein
MRGSNLEFRRFSNGGKACDRDIELPHCTETPLLHYSNPLPLLPEDGDDSKRIR